MSQRLAEPFLLQPATKDYPWGGTRLKDEYGKRCAMQKLAETWECSTHPDGLSIVASGEAAGKLLVEELAAHPSYLGKHANPQGELPILIKFIDAQENLSVQVHPDDAYANEHEHGQKGKTEMWYVLDAEPGAELIFGCQKTMEKERLAEYARLGTIEQYLNRVPVKQGDHLLIPAGQIHAICAGVMVAEIQENSNLTYRLYDYGRRDYKGNLRPLHLERAMEVADLRALGTPRRPMRIIHHKRGMIGEELCRCAYFKVERLQIRTEREFLSMQTSPEDFTVWMCLNGCGMVMTDTQSLPFFKGDTIFVPAGSVPIRLQGNATLLQVNC